MFQLTEFTQATINSVTPRVEKHGDEDKPGPVGFVNSDELDQLAGEQSISLVIEAEASGRRKTPIYDQAAIEAAVAEARAGKQWYLAVDSQLVNAGLDAVDITDDAAAAVKRLTDWAATKALDPLISDQAQALIDRGVAEARAVPDYRHVANEWADMATNGLQWLRNIVDGVSTPADALANMEACAKHCRQVNDTLAAATSPTMPAEPQTLSQRIDAAGFMRRPSLWVLQAREALELIAAPMRSDGTWNRDREVCRQIAAEALGRYDDNEPAPPARVALSEHRSRFEKWWLGRGGTRPSLYVTPAGEYEDADAAFHWGIWMGINGITQAQGEQP